MKDNFFVDTQSDKFQFYINQAILILKLNDSDLKRETLKRLLYMKFAESNPSEDDSDAPLTLALDAMRYMTDKSLRHLTSYRLLVNILPSILNSSDLDGLLTIKEYIDQNRFMNSEEILNLRRCGMIYEMSTSIYSLEAIAKGVDAELNLTDSIVTLDEDILANGFTQAGIILTDITLGYFLNFHGQYDIWLPIRHKSLHVNDLIVDNDAQVNQNMIVRGDTSSGG